MFAVFIVSCERPDSSPSEIQSDEVLQLISKPNSKIKDLEALLGEGDAANAEFVSGAEESGNPKLLEDEPITYIV